MALPAPRRRKRPQCPDEGGLDGLPEQMDEPFLLATPPAGSPVGNCIAAVSVLHESCMRADALATAMMVMGGPDAVAFATRHRIAARIVQRDAHGTSELLTPEFECLLQDDLDAA
jgi:hypothetical protein